MNWIWHFCLTNMKQRRIRTVLTILGVAIGVVSVVTLLAIGIGMKAMLVEKIEKTNKISTIVVTGVNEGKRKDKMITDQKLEDFKKINHVKAVYPSLIMGGSIQMEHFTSYSMIEGVPQEYMKTLDLKYGAYPSEEGLRPELLVGQGSLYMYYNEGSGSLYSESVGEKNIKKTDWSDQKLEVTNGFGEDAVKSKMRVSGMLDENQYSTFCDLEVLKRYLKKNTEDGLIPGQPVDQNNNAYNEWIYSQAYVIVDDIKNVDKVVKTFNDYGFQTENDKEFLDSVNKITKIAQLVLGIVGMIALVVAVIGIGNTMTTSVYDRLTEIGILKMLGCDPDELLSLFLLESAIIGAIGGCIGVALSYLTIFPINKYVVKAMSLGVGSKIATIPLWLAVGAIVFAILLGVGAGFFPAKFAAKLKPIDAIRQQ